MSFCVTPTNGPSSVVLAINTSEPKFGIRPALSVPATIPTARPPASSIVNDPVPEESIAACSLILYLKPELVCPEVAVGRLKYK